MPTQQNLLAVFDFETIIAGAFADILNGLGIAAATPETVNKLQKPRPRIECIFKVSAGRKQFTTENGNVRETAWGGALRLQIITDASEDNKKMHRLLLATLRYLNPLLPALLNRTALPNHVINNVRTPPLDAGTSLTIQTAEGYWATLVDWEMDFSINANAWALLTTN